MYNMQNNLNTQKKHIKAGGIPNLLLIKSSIPCNLHGSLSSTVIHNTLIYKN